MGAPQASAPVRGRVSRGALGPVDDAVDLGLSEEQRCRRRPQRTVAGLAQPMRLLLARPVAGAVAGEHLRVELRLSARHRDLDLPQGAAPCRAAARDRGSPRGGALRARPRPPGPEAPRSGPVARRSLGLSGMSRRHHREPYDRSVLVDAVPRTSVASGDPTGRCLAVEQPARLDAGVDRHSACAELLQAVAVEVQPEAL